MLETQKSSRIPQDRADLCGRVEGCTRVVWVPAGWSAAVSRGMLTESRKARKGKVGGKAVVENGVEDWAASDVGGPQVLGRCGS